MAPPNRSLGTAFAVGSHEHHEGKSFRVERTDFRIRDYGMSATTERRMVRWNYRGRLAQQRRRLVLIGAKWLLQGSTLVSRWAVRDGTAGYH